LAFFNNECSKTLTHFHTHLEKYQDVLRYLISKEGEQQKCMDTIKKFCLGSNFHIILYIEHMENAKILNYKNIIAWLFKEIEKEEDSTNNFRLYWDLLFSIIQRLLKRSDIAKIELRKVEKRKS
jgi:hypothetical protein